MGKLITYEFACDCKTGGYCELFNSAQSVIRPPRTVIGVAFKMVAEVGARVNLHESAHGISQRNGSCLPKRIAQLIYNQEMRAVAIKKSSREKTTGFQEMGTLRCDGCGEEFFIGHEPKSADKWVAARQAAWLEKVFAEEHERDGKHADRIELPD